MNCNAFTRAKIYVPFGGMQQTALRTFVYRVQKVCLNLLKIELHLHFARLDLVPRYVVYKSNKST